MSDPRHIEPEDLALHAMGLLSKEEAAIIDAQLEQSSELQREYLALQNDLAVVALSAEQEAPAPEARSRFLQQIAKEKRVVSIDRGAVPMQQNDAGLTSPKQGGRLLPWLGWAVAAGVVFAATPMYRERGQLQATVADQSAQLKSETAQMATLTADAARAKTVMDALTDSNAMRVTLNTTPAVKTVPQGRATYVADKGALIFTANNLQPLPPAKVYELWIIPANGTAPVPAGTFRPDGRGYASVVMPSIPTGVQAKAFGVTMEAEGGASTPTMPILMVGA
jgi:anti-sigma-K factor RskA